MEHVHACRKGLTVARARATVSGTAMQIPAGAIAGQRAGRSSDLPAAAVSDTESDAEINVLRMSVPIKPQQDALFFLLISPWHAEFMRVDV